MNTNMYIPLTEQNIQEFIGKTIGFAAEGYNRNYQGVVLIKSVDMSQKNPISCEVISGDDLQYAFLDDHGLITADGGETYQLTKEFRCFSYSDSYREVFVRVCE